MKIKRLLAVLLAAAMALAAGGCESGSEISPRASVTYPRAAEFDDYETERRIRDENPVQDSTYEAVNDFSYLTASAILSGKEENGNYSPLSLYYALALSASGAKGETQAQLLALLGIESLEELEQECGNLYRLLYQDNDVTKLKIANSLWLDEDTSFKEDFLSGAAENFYASSYEVDFTAPETGDAMSKWVSDNTNGLLAPSFQPNEEGEDEQILSILNTIYFKDEWYYRFSEEMTKADVFHGPGGDAEIEFMNRTESTGSVYRGEGFIRSDLGLKGDGNMVFILPDEGIDIESLLSSPERLKEAFEGGESQSGQVIWKIPKMDFSASYNLKEPLQGLGLALPFDDERADFSGIADVIDKLVYISNIRQESCIAIDEKGVEAAAFTEVLYLGATAAPPDNQFEMILDRPFIYGIESSGGAMLFIGAYFGPEA